MIPEVLLILLFDLFFVLLGTVAFVVGVKIVRGFKSQNYTAREYKLQKEGYLAATILYALFGVKIALFFFFVFTLEQFALLLPGAMCSAGVVNATPYGAPLFILKIINLYLFAYWMVLHRHDMQLESQPYMRGKFALLLFLYFLMLAEIALEILLFWSIDFQKVVDCCGVVFSSSDGTYLAMLLGAPFWLHALLFYGVFSIIIFAFLKKNRTLFAFMNFLFVFVALVTLIGSFGTYIYEMPTHHCPFCFLSKEYHFVGYLLYLLLFLGTFFGMVIAFVSFEARVLRKYFLRSLVANTLYVLLASAYVLHYYFVNGMLL